MSKTFRIVPDRAGLISFFDEFGQVWNTPSQKRSAKRRARRHGRREKRLLLNQLLLEDQQDEMILDDDLDHEVFLEDDDFFDENYLGEAERAQYVQDYDYGPDVWYDD